MLCYLDSSPCEFDTVKRNSEIKFLVSAFTVSIDGYTPLFRAINTYMQTNTKTSKSLKKFSSRDRYKKTFENALDNSLSDFRGYIFIQSMPINEDIDKTIDYLEKSFFEQGFNELHEFVINCLKIKDKYCFSLESNISKETDSISLPKNEYFAFLFIARLLTMAYKYVLVNDKNPLYHDYWNLFPDKFPCYGRTKLHDILNTYFFSYNLLLRQIIVLKNKDIPEFLFVDNLAGMFSLYLNSNNKSHLDKKITKFKELNLLNNFIWQHLEHHSY